MKSKRPRLICHMVSSVDGRIISENWGKSISQSNIYSLYEKCHRSFKSEAWMAGRVSFQKDLTPVKRPGLSRTKGKIQEKYFIGDRKASSFAIAVDPSGKLGWQSGDLMGDHVIVILTKQAGQAYLRYLQKKSISYIVAGEKNIDFRKALIQLAKLFPIHTITLEGGGILNGTFLGAGLIDELSLLIIPVADGTQDANTTFEKKGNLPKKKASLMQLMEVKQLSHGVLWLKYKMKK